MENLNGGSSAGAASSSGTSSRRLDGSAALVRLSIKCPSSEAPNSEGEMLSVSASTTIAQVKKHIETTWPGQPKAEGMRCIRAGRLLDDAERVGDVLAGTDLTDAASLHLVVRPDAWSRPPPPRLTRTATSETPTLPRVDSTATTALLRIIETMNPASYVQFQGVILWACHINLDAYQALWYQTYGGPQLISSLQAICAATSMTHEEIKKAVATLEKDVLGWEQLDEMHVTQQQPDQPDQHIYQPINVGNMPYLLRLTLTPELEAANARLAILHARYTALRDLHVRLGRLITLHSASGTSTTRTSPSALARQRRSLDAAYAIPGFGETQPQQTPAAAAAAAAGGGGVNVTVRLNPDPLQDPATRRRIIFLLLLNEFTHVALPMLYLSLKLAMLVYVFSRGASSTKRYCMIGAAAVYVLYEGWRIMGRRRRVRERELQGRARRNGVRGAAAAAAAATPEAVVTPAAAAPETAAGAATLARDDGLPVIPPIPATQAPLRHRATSPLTLAYWTEAMAYIHLATEDEALGLTPPSNTARRSHRRRAAAAAHVSWTSLLYTRVMLPLILFVGTLVPEVELRRRRAIEERENLVRTTALLQEDRERLLKERQEEIEKRRKELKTATAAAAAKEKEAEASTSTPPAAAVRGEVSTTTALHKPSLLRNAYADRILRQRTAGQGARQIDIQEELDAQAARNDDDMDAEEDLGFF